MDTRSAMKAAPAIADKTHTPPANPGATCAAEKWREYSRLKMEWIRRHPLATPREIEAACFLIAADLGV